MLINNFKLEIKDGILIISKKDKTVELYEVSDLKSLMEESTGKKYYYAIYANSLGYYTGYDFECNEYVYCGSLSIPRNITRMKAYISNKSKEDEE